MLQHLRHNGRTLHHTGIRCQVPPQYSYASGGGIRILYGADHLRVLILTSFDILTDRFPGHCHAIQVQKPQLTDLVHHCIHTAGLIQILHIGWASRRQMTQIRSSGTDLIGNIHIQLHPGLMGNRRQMQHTVGTAAQCHIHGQSIAKSRLSHDIFGADISFHHIHHRHARMLSQADPLRIYCRNGSVAPKSHTQHLGQTVHAVRRVHAGA